MDFFRLCEARCRRRSPQGIQMVPLELPAEHRGDRGDGRRYLGDHQKGWLLRFDFRGCLSGAAGSISFPHEAETDTIEQVAR